MPESGAGRAGTGVVNAARALIGAGACAFGDTGVGSV